MKYIIIERNGLEVPILFADFEDHNKIAEALGGVNKITGAGFCQFISGDNYKALVKCYGESFTLGIKSKPEDEILINRMLNPE